MIPLAHRHKKKKKKGPPIRLRWDYEIREIIKKELLLLLNIFSFFLWPVLIEWVVASSDLLRAPAHSDSHPLMRITVAAATLRKTPWTHFCLFFSAKNLKIKTKQKQNISKEYIYVHRHTDTTIFICTPRATPILSAESSLQQDLLSLRLWSVRAQGSGQKRERRQQ